MVSGSHAQMTSALIPPVRTSAATRALSWPVGARNTSTLTPGCFCLYAAITARSILSVAHVYRVRVFDRFPRALVQPVAASVMSRATTVSRGARMALVLSGCAQLVEHRENELRHR